MCEINIKFVLKKSFVRFNFGLEIFILDFLYWKKLEKNIGFFQDKSTNEKIQILKR